MDTAGLRIRVDDDLRRHFIEACRAQDTTASQVLRAFMRKYVGSCEASKRMSASAHPEADNQASPVRTLRVAR